MEDIATTSYDTQSLPVVLLPPDIICIILLCLPVKVLLKMRCVSKSWLSLISNPQFIRTHLKLSANDQQIGNHSLLYLNNWKNFYTCSLCTIMHKESPCSIPIELDRKKPYFHILGSCDGLFCISIGFRRCFIWNPCTRELKELPPSVTDVLGSSPLAVGFGYNERQNDYKLVVISRERKKIDYGFSNEVKFYSLKRNSWQKIKDFPRAMICGFIGMFGKFVNGRLHWIAYPEAGSSIVGSKFILSLDLVDETYRNVVFPGFDDKLYWKLGTLGGKLCVFYNQPHNGRMDVWVMKEYGVVESWSKVVSIPLNYIGHGFCPIFIFQNDGILVQVGSSLVLYDWTNDSFKHPKIQVDFGYASQIDTYIESLISPNLVVGS